MSYHGDVALGQTIDIKFTTRRFSSGAPFTLAGTPVISAYVGNGTTEITAGITLSVDFDARTGLNNVRVVATSGNGFAAQTDVELVITTGTVDSVSVVGEVIGSFSIENRAALRPTVAGRTLGVEASGKATGVVLTDTLTTYTSNTPQTGDNFARIGALGAGLTALGDTRIANLDAAVTTRMATYTQPTGFLAATFPTGTIANTTNLTAGTIANLTNLPAAAALEATLTAMKGATFSGATDSLEALRDRGDAAWITATGFSTLDAAGVRTAVGLATANLDTQLSGIDTKTTNLPSDPADQSLIIAATNAIVGLIGTPAGASLAADIATRLAAAGYTAPPTVAAIADGVWDEPTAGHAGAGTTGLALTSASAPTAAQNADAVWDELLSGHVIAGSAGAGLAAAGSAGDPWATLLPGAYAAGTAGKIVSEIVSPDHGLGEIYDLIDWGGPPMTPAELRSAIGMAAADLDTQLGAIDDAVDAEISTLVSNVAAILADTGTDGVVLSAATCNKIADHIVRRSLATALASADGDAKAFRSLAGAISKLTNRVAIESSDLNIYEPDDATVLGTQALTVTPNADPITAVDTA